ncbi:MAG: LytTR family DNA-binding domain-containing protein [Bacteroidales bacterium]|nr:LytTR family DNA-binding domain-containing protein [Bacteroidales bacterium]
MKVKCLVIDDEPLAQEVLVQYIGDCPSLELLQVCSDAIEAGECLRNFPVDLLFLDINMPRLSGIRFVKTLTQPVLVIFTTAYPEFAAEGFESNAVDYLVKPFSFERFMNAVNKAIEWKKFRNNKGNTANEQSGQDREFILFRADKRIYKIDFGDILYFESTGDYIKVNTRDKKLVVHETFKNLIMQLPGDQFVRVHRSFVISLAWIRMIEGNQVDVAGNRIPIGLVYKDGLLEKLNLKNHNS